MELLVMVLFALALNLDSFGAGVAYGARKIRVPFSSLLIISLISVAAISISMFAGRVFANFLTPAAAHRVGGILLLCIGVWVLFQSYRSGNPTRAAETGKTVEEQPKIVEIRIRPLGLVVQILREPARADLDQSGVITASEALLLGVALAMDAFGAGFAASMMGFSIVATALVVGIGHFCLTFLGIAAGRLFAGCRLGRQLVALPGFLLILLGILKLRF